MEGEYERKRTYGLDGALPRRFMIHAIHLKYSMIDPNNHNTVPVCYDLLCYDLRRRTKTASKT